MKKLSLMMLVLLSACTPFRGFKPPPDAYEEWSKKGLSVYEVKEAMRLCHYPNASGYDWNLSMEQKYFMHVCMLKKGFVYSDGDVCKSVEHLPSCIAYLRGKELSADELEVIETKVSLPRYFSSTKYKEFGWWKTGEEKPKYAGYRTEDERLKAQKIKEDNVIKIRKLADQMKVCGYPEVIESNSSDKYTEPKTVSYAELGRMERCMEKAGYEYEYPNLRVCVMYPQIRGCD